MNSSRNTSNTNIQESDKPETVQTTYLSSLDLLFPITTPGISSNVMIQPNVPTTQVETIALPRNAKRTYTDADLPNEEQNELLSKREKNRIHTANWRNNQKRTIETLESDKKNLIAKMQEMKFEMDLLQQENAILRNELNKYSNQRVAVYPSIYQVGSQMLFYPYHSLQAPEAKVTQLNTKQNINTTKEIESEIQWTNLKL